MEHLELVEKLVAKTGVSYEEAKRALEENNWDILDAIVSLEKEGRLQAPATHSFSTQYEQTEQFEKAANAHSKGSSFSDTMNRFFGWCGEMIRKGNENFFNIKKDGKLILTMPVTIFVILMIFAFGIILPLMIIGLFFSFKYSFTGNIAGDINLNDAMDKASDMAENLKKDIGGNFENE